MAAFTDLWHGHPINHSVSHPCVAPRDFTNAEGTSIRQYYPAYPNQCAIRMGIALKRAGIAPLRGIATCGCHPPDEMHYINATTLANGIGGARLPNFGAKEVYPGPEYYSRLFGRTGVMFIKDYWSRGTDSGKPTGDHIDVWNGYRSSAKWLMEWFSWVGYYSNYAGASEIWFWEVK